MNHDQQGNETHNELPVYQQPAITDYGTLLELTAGAHRPNSDVTPGASNTAFPSTT